MHVLVDAEIDLDRGISGASGNLDHRLDLGVRRDAQLAELLDPVAAAGLLNVGLAATFRLHGDHARPQQSSRNGRGVFIIPLDNRFRQRRAIEQALPFAGVQNNLREGNRAIGDEGNRESRIFPGFIALQRFG